jgi:hypothetical protein
MTPTHTKAGLSGTEYSIETVSEIFPLESNTSKVH